MYHRYVSVRSCVVFGSGSRWIPPSAGLPSRLFQICLDLVFLHKARPSMGLPRKEWPLDRVAVPDLHHGSRIPSRPKLLQENSLQRKSFEAINFVNITKQSLYKTNSLARFLVKGTHQWQQHYKENRLVELFL